MARAHVRLSLAIVAAATLAAALPPAPAAADVTVWAVGDGAGQRAGSGDDAVAGRIEAGGLNRFVYLGDVYESGRPDEFAAYYHPTFGRFRSVSHPTPGNHEWSNRAIGYDPYWGALARQQPGGGHYYSFDLGSWHFVSLNSNEDTGASSAQLAWLRQDLARRRGTCTIAFGHHSRYSARPAGDTVTLEPLWSALVGRAVAVLAGHDHNYQRFKPDRGIVPFVVGTGGQPPFTAVNEADPRLAASFEATPGALRVRLARGAARFAFVPAQGAAVDSGRLACRPQTARISIRRPLDGRFYARGLRTLRGRMSGARGRAQLTLVRHADGRCRRFDGRRFRRASCRTRRSFAAGSPSGWRIKLLGRRGLPAGRYRLTVGVVGNNGATVSERVRFRVP